MIDMEKNNGQRIVKQVVFDAEFKGIKYPNQVIYKGAKLKDIDLHDEENTWDTITLGNAVFDVQMYGDGNLGGNLKMQFMPLKWNNTKELYEMDTINQDKCDVQCNNILVEYED